MTDDGLERRLLAVPRGFPFFSLAAEDGRTRGEFTYRRRFRVAGKEVEQLWTVTAKETTLPGRWDQTVYEGLLAYRRLTGDAGDESVSFAMADFADFLQGAREERVCRALLESLQRTRPVAVDLSVRVGAELEVGSHSTVLSSVSYSRRGYGGAGGSFDVKVGFWPDLWAPV